MLVIFVIEAIRRSHLNARYAVQWLGAGGALLLFSLYRPLLHWSARMLGISYPPSLAVRCRVRVLARDHAPLLAGDLVAPRFDSPPRANHCAAASAPLKKNASAEATRDGARTVSASRRRQGGATAAGGQAAKAPPAARQAAPAPTPKTKPPALPPVRWPAHLLALATIAVLAVGLYLRR
jgi:hypothetical protein